MDTLQPADIVARLIRAGAARNDLRVSDVLVRGMLSGALLGIATSLALGAAVQTGQPVVGALIFPVGFAMIVVLGLELVTGNFALMPMAVMARQATPGQMLSNWTWSFIGNLLGSALYALLLVITLTNAWHLDITGVADRIRATAEAKTLAYEHAGAAGMLSLFVKAMLCNWMVCMGVTMSMSSTSTFGRILGCWLPIFTFFAQGFEHAVVNMFVIPAGMMMGAKVGLYDWWVWNEIPATLGNLAGGFLFTALALYVTYAGPGRAAATGTTAAPDADAVVQGARI